MNNLVVRTRIAPSPTGEDIHIGNLYTALINWIFAKKHNGKFVVRIEDTDKTRLVAGSEERILATLKKYGINYDEGPYRQSDRLSIYKKYAEELVEKKAAYYCFCTKERLDEIRKKQQLQKKITKYDKHCLLHEKNPQDRIAKGESYVIRLNVPEQEEVVFNDIIRGRISFQSADIDDQVLLKSDGYPTYHLAVVADDHLMNISHIIRAEEWISSTPKHILLYKAFGWELPIFAHLPILRNPDRSKLSKRKNPVWAGWYLEQGYLPEAVLNYLALMGWSHPGGKEIFSLSEFKEKFELKDINPAGPIFDLQKLTWMNGVYIRQLSISELESRILNYESKIEGVDRNLLKNLINLAQSRMETLKDFYPLIRHFLEEPENFTSNENEKKIVKELLARFKNISSWQKDVIFEVLKELMFLHKVRMPVFYRLFTGQGHGLPLPESLELLGKEKTIIRLERINI